MLYEDKIENFKKYLYKTKSITGYSINDNHWHLVLGFINIDYLEELLDSNLVWRNDYKRYFYNDNQVEDFKQKLNPIIKKFKELDNEKF